MLNVISLAHCQYIKVFSVNTFIWIRKSFNVPYFTDDGDDASMNVLFCALSMIIIFLCSLNNDSDFLYKIIQVASLFWGRIKEEGGIRFNYRKL